MDFVRMYLHNQIRRSTTQNLSPNIVPLSQIVSYLYVRLCVSNVDDK